VLDSWVGTGRILAFYQKLAILGGRFVQRISYVDPATLNDPEAVEIMEYARLNGTPRPESQAIRAHVPAVLRSFSETWDAVFRNGVCDHTVKELCRVYVSRSIDCGY
jgi:hypothetical protein